MKGCISDGNCYSPNPLVNSPRSLVNMLLQTQLSRPPCSCILQVTCIPYHNRLRLRCAATNGNGRYSSSCNNSNPGINPLQDGTIEHQSSWSWQHRIARTAVASLSAAALGLVLCQNRAQAASVAAASQTSQHTPAVVLQQTPATPGATATFSSLTNNGNELYSAMNYQMLKLLAAPTYGKILAVLAVAAPILALGSVLYHHTAKGSSWPESFVKPYSVLLDCPGSSVESERGPAADLVLHIVYLVGVLSFAAVLGIVCDDIGTEVDKVRRGNHPVCERGHTVVMNWNKQTMPVLQQMALARLDSGGVLFNTPVVVLADKDKEEMDALVAEELNGSGLNIITRSGNPAKAAEQHRAAAAAASTVVLLWPSGLPPASASAHTAAAVSALRAAGGTRRQKVVVQSLGEAVADFDAAQIAADLAQSGPGGQQVASLTSSGHERIHQMMAQVANQPGLEDVLADLLEYEERGVMDDTVEEELGAELYTVQCPTDLEGKSYQLVRRSFPRATVVGWVSGLDGKLHLNSRDSTIVAPGSQIIFVAGGVGNPLTQLDQPYTVTNNRLGRRRRRGSLPARNITCLCFNKDVAESVARSMAEFSGRGSKITLVCPDPDREALKKLKLRGIKLKVVEGNPSSRKVLASKEAALHQAHSVVLCGLGEQGGTAADVQVVASVLQLQSIAASQDRQQPLAIVATLHESSSGTEDVLWHTTLSYHAELKAQAANKAAAELQRQRARARKGKAAAAATAEEVAAVAAAAAAAVTPPVSLHVLRPDELKAGMITQTAVSPQLAAVFSELFTQQTGHELYLRHPQSSYGLPLGKPLAWRDVVETVRRLGDTAIGFTKPAAVTGSNSSMQLGHGSEVHLGVMAESEVTLSPDDRLVVVALD